MPKLRELRMGTAPEGNPVTDVSFACPGCGDTHTLPVRTATRSRPAWNYNGNPDRPTLQPSILCRSGHHATGEPPGNCWCDYEKRAGKPAPFACGICHSYVTDGRIQFLPDCTHALRGQTVDLPEVPAPVTT